jgi:predicted nucleic acid-binding protein
MTGLDSNILVQLALQDHPANVATIAAVQAETQRGHRLVFPSLVVDEFLHVITDARRFSPPLTMIEALDWVENFTANPAVGLLEPTPETFRQTLRWLREFNLGRKRILDTQLAAVFHTGGVRRLLTSNPADFTGFGVFEIITP